MVRIVRINVRKRSLVDYYRALDSKVLEGSEVSHIITNSQKQRTVQGLYYRINTLRREIEGLLHWLQTVVVKFAVF